MSQATACAGVAPRTLFGTLGPFSAFVQSPPVIPTFYYDVYSQEQRIKAICENFARLVAYVEEGFSEVHDVDDEVQAQLNAFRITVEQSLNDLRDELVKLIAGATGSFTTVDPTDGYRTKDAGSVIGNVYDFDRELSMSAARFDAANITPAMFDATGMSARHFDTAAAAWLYNPATAETISEDDGENDGLSVMRKIAENASGVDASKSAAVSAKRAAAAQTAAQSAASSATASESAAKAAQEAAQESASAAQKSASAAQKSASAAQESASAAQESASAAQESAESVDIKYRRISSFDITENCYYYANGIVENSPTGTPAYGFGIMILDNPLYGFEMFTQLTSSRTFVRTISNGVYSGWKEL